MIILIDGGVVRSAIELKFSKHLQSHVCLKSTKAFEDCCSSAHWLWRVVYIYFTPHKLYSAISVDLE